MEENKDESITLSKEDLKAIFGELIQPFTDAAAEMKAIGEKARSEEVGKDGIDGLLAKDANYRFAMQLSASGHDNVSKLNPVNFKKQFGKTTAEVLEMIDKVEKAAAPLNVTTSADGGYVVPALTEQNIMELAATYGQAYKYFNVMPMGQNPVNLPKESTAQTVYWVGENETISEGKEQLGIDTLTPKKVAALTTISNELLKVPSPSMGAYVTKKMAQRILTAIDTKCFQNGATTLTGVFYTSNSFGNSEPTSGTNPNSLTYQDFVNAAYNIDAAKLIGASWFMNRAIAAVARGLTDQTGRPIFEPAAAGMPATLLGFPVVLIEAAPNGAASASKPIVLLGNLSNSTLGDIGGIGYDIFNSGSVSSTSLIENDLSAIRAIKQVAFTPGLVSEYSVIKTAAA